MHSTFLQSDRFAGYKETDLIWSVVAERAFAAEQLNSGVRVQSVRAIQPGCILALGSGSGRCEPGDCLVASEPAGRQARSRPKAASWPCMDTAAPPAPTESLAGMLASVPAACTEQQTGHDNDQLNRRDV